MLDLAMMPALPDGMTRRLYVRCIDATLWDSLLSKGYEVVDLFSLPRNTDEENVAYLKAKAQALEENTVEFNREERMALELEMKAAGLLERDAGAGDGKVTLTGTVEELLSWGNSSHTLRDNSTVQSAQSPLKVVNDD